MPECNFEEYFLRAQGKYVFILHVSRLIKNKIFLFNLNNEYDLHTASG